MRLQNEIKGCTLGGESVVADWYFGKHSTIVL
jgi:hypothetical protein